MAARGYALTPIQKFSNPILGYCLLEPNFDVTLRDTNQTDLLSQIILSWQNLHKLVHKLTMRPRNPSTLQGLSHKVQNRLQVFPILNISFAPLWSQVYTNKCLLPPSLECWALSVSHLHGHHLNVI